MLGESEAFFIEVKAEGGKLSKLQEREHAILRRAGFNVHVLVGEREVNHWIASRRSFVSAYSRHR